MWIWTPSGNVRARVGRVVLRETRLYEVARDNHENCTQRDTSVKRPTTRGEPPAPFGDEPF